MSWKEKRLGEVVRLQRGHDLTDEERRPGDVPVIGSAGQNGCHDTAIVRGPGITLGRSGGSIGKVTYCAVDFWPHNTTIYVTDFLGNDPTFLRYYLPTLDLKSLNSGSAQPSLNRNFVYHAPIRVPDPNEQRRIGEALVAYDDLIETNRRRMALLEEAARLIYREWFVRLRFPGHEPTKVRDGVPAGWRRRSLTEVATVNRASLTSDFDGEIEYVDIASVTPGSINESQRFAFADAPSRARRVVEHGDIIWSCVRPNRRSHAIVFDPAPDTIVSTGFAVLTPQEEMPTSYLYHATTTDEFVGYLENRARGAAYPAVTARDFENAEILVPAPSVLEEFDLCVGPLLQQQHTLRLQNQKLRAARDLLLPKLMSGRIEV